jgi:cardiolipin synthase
MPKLRLSIRRLLFEGILAFILLQLGVIGTIVLSDTWRRRFRPQGRFPRMLPPEPVHIGSSVVQVYTYGQDLYAEMLSAIKKAKKRIFFETFIWKDDVVGQKFKQELIKAAERGVDVYIIFDTFANLVVPNEFKRFPRYVHVLKYPLISWPIRPFQIRTYARDHRKILVVDSLTAFVGGYNVGEAYATQWRDTHIWINGPAAFELENVFIDFWNQYRTRDLPELGEGEARDWDSRIIIDRNDPQMVIFPVRMTYLEAIDRAQHHIYLTQAYFIPDSVILQMLIKATKRGVDVRILVPELSNHIIADWLSRGLYTRCLKNGIRLFLYRNAMIHAKTCTIDSIWSTVGTTNLDRLSLVGNFEVNAEIYDKEFAQEMEKIFECDLKNARELTLKEWERRSFFNKFGEMVLEPLRPLY